MISRAPSRRREATLCVFVIFLIVLGKRLVGKQNCECLAIMAQPDNVLFEFDIGSTLKPITQGAASRLAITSATIASVVVKSCCCRFTRNGISFAQRHHASDFL